MMYPDETLRHMPVYENEWLSIRTQNALRNAGYASMLEVKRDLKELRHKQGIGKRALQEIKESLVVPVKGEVAEVFEWVDRNFDLVATIKKNVQAGMQIAFLLPKDMERGK